MTPRQRLLAAMEIIHKEHDLSAAYAILNGDRGDIEAVAHELAHAIDLGPRFEGRLDGMSARLANAHEASVLRIEIAALRRLGMRVSLRNQWRRADWRGDGAARPAWTVMRLPLTAHERWCVRGFMRIVRDATRRFK